jgi:hypothetical protein
MLTPVDNTQRTRWDELCEIAKVVLKIGVIFDSNGVEIYFLNRGSFQNVKDPHIVDKFFQTPPSGYTPLVPVLNEIFTSKLANRGWDKKKLLVFVATDGVPTDEDGNENVQELERTMREKRRIETTYVSFLLCTDDPTCDDYLTEWDRTGELFFSRGEYVVKALVGAIDPEIDALNEPT